MNWKEEKKINFWKDEFSYRNFFIKFDKENISKFFEKLETLYYSFQDENCLFDHEVNDQINRELNDIKEELEDEDEYMQFINCMSEFVNLIMNITKRK